MPEPRASGRSGPVMAAPWRTGRTRDPGTCRNLFNSCESLGNGGVHRCSLFYWRCRKRHLLRAEHRVVGGRGQGMSRIPGLRRQEIVLELVLHDSAISPVLHQLNQSSDLLFVGEGDEMIVGG